MVNLAAEIAETTEKDKRSGLSPDREKGRGGERVKSVSPSPS